VGHGDDRAGVLAQEVLEPVDRFGVQMVRRLVEQQQVGMLEQEPGERHAALLAARDLRDIGVVGRAAEGLHRDLDVALDVPGVRRVDPVLECCLLRADGLVVGVGLGPPGHDRVVLVDEVPDRGDAVHDVALHVLGRVELWLLAQEPDAEARGQAGLAGEAIIEAGHDPEEARLARPVRADDADLGARIERDRDVLEDRPVRRVVPGEAVGAVDELGGHGPRVAVGWRLAPVPPGRARIDDYGVMRERSYERRMGIAALAILAVIVATCGDGVAPSATPSVGGTATPATPTFTVDPTARPSAPLPSTAPTFADAWLAVVEPFDAQSTDLLISNPLSEWDLVGTRLIDLIGRTRGQLGELAPPAELDDDTGALDEAIGTTQAMLEAIEPHGDKTKQAEAFQLALDDWAEHVRPQAEAIRVALGLPPVPAGDLHL
jgi:hypothetical protein